MNKHIPHIKIPNIIALTAVTGLLVIAGNIAHAQTTDPLLTDSVDQSVFPQITAQPVDQTVLVGANVVLSVQANNADGYQWLCNGVPLEGQTNSTLVIQNAGISDAGLYSCAVSLGTEAVPTRAASVSVETTANATAVDTTAASTPAASDLAASATTPGTIAASLPGGGPIVVFGGPLAGGGTQSPCPGNYAGYVNYTKTISQGWGWTPAANTTTFTAANGGGVTGTSVTYLGEYGDTGCGRTTVTIPNPPPSPAYRFTIFFPKTVPTTNYPIVLTGFNP
ncbi:MAG: immunoglobulin domain-containing protein [Limisphaerales bacterium]